MDDGAMGEINLGFTMDEINGVLVLRPSACSGEREQLFLVSHSLLPLSLPFPESAAGFVSLPALRLRPTHCLGPALTTVGRCPKLRGPPRSFPSVWVTSAAYSINNPGPRPRPEDQEE